MAKVLMFNGSPHKSGAVHKALGLVAEPLNEEGVQILHVLGHNVAWLIKSIEAGRAAGIRPPAPYGKRIATNFVR